MTRIIGYIGHRAWGDAIHFLDETEEKVYGWKPDRFSEGSILISHNPDKGKSKVYRITSIEWQKDPKDMFFADVEFLEEVDSNEIGTNDFNSYLVKTYMPVKSERKFNRIFGFMLIGVILSILLFIYLITRF